MDSLSSYTDSNPSSPSQPIRNQPQSNIPQKLRPGIYNSSQVNPNSSSTNLFKLTPLLNHNDSSSSLPMYNPHPKNRINLNNYHISSNTSLTHLPLTPPLSKPSSPIRLQSSSTTNTSASSTASVIYHKLINNLPPIDIKITILSSLWYLTSIISSNSTKSILTQFQYPITLTEFQFSLNALFCIILLGLLNLNPSLIKVFPIGTIPTNLSIPQFLTPTAKIISTTLPMGGFQFIGHLTSHKATSLIPVSLVHTIKSLSPLVTVFIYRFLFSVTYKSVTYITLIPLIIGIMLTCYKPASSTSTPFYFTGLLFAFISMMIFVSQNIFAKNRLTIKETSALPNFKDKQSQDIPQFPTSSSSSSSSSQKSSFLNNMFVDNSNDDKKLDKLTILFYCSSIGFLLTLPVYLISELINNDKISLFNLSNSIFILIIINGFAHFLQSLLAFQILGMLSPVNYSIASILKRIVIILISFIWENKINAKKFSSLQQFGLLLTLFGLYCYDRWGVSSHNTH
ncbi:member of triose phosphate translocator family [Scheffersomyces coipomensis]|uniref:member of triose phosphate translocator family n=1 Tax=Scheffersomyces coipomensis TaxID=1788519 RepID=UPI00315D6AF9